MKSYIYNLETKKRWKNTTGCSEKKRFYTVQDNSVNIIITQYVQIPRIADLLFQQRISFKCCTLHLANQLKCTNDKKISGTFFYMVHHIDWYNKKTRTYAYACNFFLII